MSDAATFYALRGTNTYLYKSKTNAMQIIRILDSIGVILLFFVWIAL
jgi:hypothetical protein